MEGAPLDPTDTVELAELLGLSADALSWREAHVVYPDLQAHLRRWARRLRPDTPDDPALPAGGTERSRLRSCHDTVTMTCPVCQRRFTPTGRQVYAARRARPSRTGGAVTRDACPCPSPRAVPAGRSPSMPATIAAGGPSASCTANRARLSCPVGIGGSCPSWMPPSRSPI